MKNTQKIIIRLLSGMIAAQLLLGQWTAYAATSSNVTVDVSDTIAGYSALVTVSNTLENEEIEVKLTKPNGTEIILSDTTDDNGDLQMDISGYHTNTAGVYKVAARFAAMNEEFGTAASFRVYPSDVSPNRSQLLLNRTTAQAMSGDTVTLTVQLKDTYGNPIKGHTVSVISSRTADRVERASTLAYTDDTGVMQFSLSSTTSGVSTYAVMDTTSNVTLESRAKVAYLTPFIDPFGSGGEANLFFTSVNAATTTTEEGVISGFAIEDLPATASVNESLSVTVSAVDGLGNTIANYTGTIRFSVSDANASLPDDYTFTENDLGTHTFNLALSFATEGTQTLSVIDSDNEDLKGEAIIEIGNDQTNDTTTSTGATFTLLSPVEGTVSENTVTVSGITSSGLTVQVYDNDSQMATTIAGADGSFSYTSDPLVDGTHRISVIVVDGNGNTVAASNSVNVTIDTTGPTLDAIMVEPEGELNPSAPITITLYSEPNLTQAAVVLNDSITDLTEQSDQPGVYMATVTTPAETGTYNIDVMLSDQLSNGITYTQKTTITVTQEETVVLPDQVSGVTAVAGDGTVTLGWESVGSDTTVTNYRIYYGPSETGLYTTVDTSDAGTTWQIRDLNNNFKYYFAVTAIDQDGDESGTQSVIVSSMPKAATTQTVATETQEEATEVLHESAPEETPDSGPELWILLALTISAATGYAFAHKKDIQ